MIKELSLKNFKLFEEETLHLSPLTLISGVNGMGKSSIIQSLLLLKQSFAIGYLQGQGKVDLDNDFVNLESAQDVCYTMTDDNDRNVEISILTDDGQHHKFLLDASDPKKKVLNCFYTGNGELQNLPLFSEDFIYLDAERWGPRETYLKKERRAYNTKIGIQGELAPAYILQAIATNETIGIAEMRYESLEDNDLYENLNAWFSHIVGLPLKSKVTEQDEAKLRLSYNIEGAKGQDFSALQVGFGLTYSLPIVLAALSAKRGDLLIIENPEAHLHPSAQVKIGLLLSKVASLGVQVIVESHSDHVLNSIRYAFHEGILTADMVKILFVRNIKVDGFNTPLVDYINLVANGKLSQRPDNFFDTWDTMLTKLL